MTRIGDLAAASDSLVLTDAAAPGGGGRIDLRIAGGRIAGVSPAGTTPHPPDATVVPLDGRVVAPAFVEPHLHLDKALLGTPAEGGDLRAAIAYTAQRKRGFTYADVQARAERVLTAALRAGTTAIRAQTEVDPAVGLLSIQVMQVLAERHRSWLDLQIAVFPQEGILSRPGTLALMREALALPGTIVGGCPYTEADATAARAHVDQVLDLAVEFGTFADLHLDLADDTSDERFALAPYVARATRERGLAGRVAIGHVTSLAAIEVGERARVLDELASAGVSVVVLPATDLYLMGRSDASNARRGVVPVSDLWAHGVRTALSSNNLRNAFTPTGRADPLDIALLAGRVSFASSREDFLRLHRAVTTDAAAVLGSDRARGLAPGAPADLVVFDSTDPDAVVLDQPTRLLVLADGRPAYSSALEETFHRVVPLPA
ncbi:amidohydrolase family protein [Microbacterium ureisolvens]|uniref:Amidohydrolase family protein n=1 Tax=Microbacterium ureisolvens TaxID=2781186 RepID=A0ABS7HVT0_9MICO|nr:amidohydrolase family protein [Microbacterium ureisolvens]MBW9108494.1 amidohydrolase family protein [Microbacterium ureisolvens]